LSNALPRPGSPRQGPTASGRQPANPAGGGDHDPHHCLTSDPDHAAVVTLLHHHRGLGPRMDNLTGSFSTYSRSLANPRRVRLVTAYREGRLVPPTLRRAEQPPRCAGRA
jgi:hypothetical protein